jgi:membrane protein DedA with SNARE-associated domain
LSIADFAGWIAQHSQLAGLAVFLIAMAESLAVVGLIVPGVAMMFGAGALVGTGTLPFGPICAYAVAGAIAGDGLSFWVGRHFRERLVSLWPFTRYPGMIEHGIAFFRRYGGRSVLLGRFVGPVRAVIPLVAGMLAMPVRQFLLVNLISALLWAPAYLLPGMVFGASVELASQVTGRLAALLIALLALLWFTAWLSHRLYAWFRPHAHELILLTFDLCKAHPLFARLTAPLIDPNQRDYAGLLVWAVILAATGVIAGTVVAADALPVSLEPWRNPIADYLLAVCAGLGSVPGILAFSGLVAGWLLLHGRRLAAAHYLMGIGFALALGALCHAAFDLPPVDGPLLRGAVSFGFVAVLLADQAGNPWRWTTYAGAALLAVAIGFARLYSGAEELLSLLFTLALALVWLILLGVAYRRHAEGEPPAQGLGAVVVLALMVVTGALASGHSLEDFVHRSPPVRIARADWLDQGWSRLPAHRLETFGRPHQPLGLQWAAPLETIRADLLRGGWRGTRPLALGPALTLLNPAAGVAELPVLPHYHQTDVDALRMLKHLPDGRWLIVRCWPSGFELADNPVPLWLGSVAFLEAHDFLGLAKFSAESGKDSAALNLFVAELRPRLPLLERAAPEGRAVILIPPPAR